MHGDQRGSMDRKHNVYGSPRLAPNENREWVETMQQKHGPVELTAQQRRIVDMAAREVCLERGYVLLAINVRTNHVHAVISAACKPESVLNALKAYATRKLRQKRLISEDAKPWVRHGSTRYLWKERHVEKAIGYVLYDQGDYPPDFDD